MRTPIGFWGSLLIVVLLALTTAVAQSCSHTEYKATATIPTFSNGTDTLPCGQVQLEYGWTRQSLGQDSRATSFTSTVSLGVTDWMDLRWSSDNLVRVKQGSAANLGAGDSWLGARVRLRKQDKFPALGVLYSIKLPASGPLSSGYVDHSLALLASKDFGRNHIDFNLVQLAMGGARGVGASTVAALAISRTLRGRLGGTLESYGGRQSGGAKFGAVTTALTWKWSDRWVSDFAMTRALTPGASPRSGLSLGTSFVLTDLFRGIGR